MSLPVITLSPTSGPAGTVVTVTVVRSAPVAVTVTATTPSGSGTSTFNIVENLTVTSNPAKTITKVSDDGTTWVGTFTA